MPDQIPLNDEEKEDLVAYLDGELDEQSSRQLEAKLNVNPKARAEAEALRRTWELLDFLPKPEPSPNFTHQTLDRVAAPKTMATGPALTRWKPWALGVGWAAALLLAGAGGYGAIRLLPHRQPTTVPQTREFDPATVPDPSTVENMHRYEQVDDLHFLVELDDPDLFGDDCGE
jgi:anti-sigma factor RsiW